MNAPVRPPRSKKPPVENKPSTLLSSGENDVIFNLLGVKCYSLATAVVQVFLSEPPGHQQWCKYYCGVACFVKDNPRRSFFIQLYDIESQEKVWEQELYDEFHYKTPRPFFHTFETDVCQAGLNFADNEEASTFENAVLKKLKQKQERKQCLYSDKTSDNNEVLVTRDGKTTAIVGNKIFPYSKDKKKCVERRKIKISKDDIGKPENFVHIQHVGWDPITGFDFTQQDCFDANLKRFFSIAGISEEELSDADTRKFIYSFLGRHGGIGAALLSVKNLASSSDYPKTYQHNKPPAPVPLCIPPNHRNLGTPPPPPARSPPPRPPPALSKDSSSTQLSNCMPPPPPPPPPPSSSCSISSQAMENSSKESNDIKGDFCISQTSSVDSRGALLNQIRQGVELRPISDKFNIDVKTPVEGFPLEDLAGALARALQERSFALQHTDDSNSGEEIDDEDDDEDWDI